jgi:hypothetical protein
VRNTHSLSSAEGECCQESEGKPVIQGTHALSSAEGGTREDSEITPASEEYSLPVEREETREDGEREPASEVHSPTVERRRHPSGKRKKVDERGALTLCRSQRGELVGTAKESQ